MLDDLKFIAQRDTSDAFGVAEKMPEQLNCTANFKLDINREINNVVLSGMGGSALVGDLYLSLAKLSVPFSVNRHYDIPEYVDEKTLFIASSCSGNTEETLSALAQAEKRGAFITAITSGGRLAEIAQEKGYPMLETAVHVKPRMSVFCQLKELSILMEKAGLADSLSSQLSDSIPFLKKSVSKWRVDVPTSQNKAKQIAEELAGKTPVIFAGNLLGSVAKKWKICLNESAKNLAFYAEWPEFNHGEMIGWTSHPIEKPFQPIELISNLEHSRIARRYKITNRLLSGQMPEPIQITAEGKTLVEQLLSTALLGDFTSLYLAMLNNQDPTKAELVDKLKSELKD